MAGPGSTPTLYRGQAEVIGISKRGNEYLRRMLLHGARSVMMQVERNPSALGVWITDLSKRKHHNVTAVALANKMARIRTVAIPIWVKQGINAWMIAAGIWASFTYSVTVTLFV
jgi:hypothetical protein